MNRFAFRLNFDEKARGINGFVVFIDWVHVSMRLRAKRNKETNSKMDINLRKFGSCVCSLSFMFF